MNELPYRIHAIDVLVEVQQDGGCILFSSVQLFIVTFSIINSREQLNFVNNGRLLPCSHGIIVLNSKQRFFPRPCLYYPNSAACYRMLLSAGDILPNPGPGLEFQTCGKIIRANEGIVNCSNCLNIIHAKCTDCKTLMFRCSKPVIQDEYVCLLCSNIRELSEFPFYNEKLLNSLN